MRGSRLAPGIAHHPDDDGGVVKDVRQDNGCQRVKQVERCAAQVKKAHQAQVDPAIGANQRIKRGSDHYGWQDERQGGEHAQQFFLES